MRNSIVLILFLIISINSNGQDDSKRDNGLYLNQEPPGMVPRTFAPEFISTQKNELNSVFSPDGKEFYYSISVPGKGYKIYCSILMADGWATPKPVSFSGEYSDVDMFITKDGKRMYFGSTRPVNRIASSDFKIWYVDKTENGWSKAKYFDTAVNNMKRALYATISDNGTIYFQGIREDTFGDRDIYFSEFKNGKYVEPVHLGREINSEYGEGDVLIAPDESYMIVNCNGRPNDLGNGDLYISFKNENGTWTELKNMGSNINSLFTDYCPMLSPDGKYFFFTSKRSGNGDIYWVDAKIIEDIKQTIIK